MSYDNTNRGAAWKNDKREKESQPTYKGNLNVEGVEYVVSFWGRKPDANPKAPDFTYQIKKKEDLLNEVKQTAQPHAGHDSFEDSDIPF